MWRRALIATVGATLVFGFIGYCQYQPKASLLDDTYAAMELAALHAPEAEGPLPLMLEIAKLTGLAASLLLIIQVIQLMLREERDAGRIKKMERHVIVCGLGWHGLKAVRQLRADNERVVAIEKAPAPDDVEACRQLDVIVLTGDATQRDVLNYARVSSAKSLLAVCPEDNTNCEIAAVTQQLRKEAQREGAPLPCRVQVGSMEAREAFQQLVNQAGESRSVQVRFFDSYDPEARQLVAEGLPIDHDGIRPGDTRPVHLVIIGFGLMGRAVAVRAAQLGVFATEQKLKISVIDRVAEEHGKALRFHHKFVDQVCDIEFLQMEALSPEARQLYEKWFTTQGITSVAICLDDSQLSLGLAVQLQPLIAGTGVRMAARMGYTSGLTTLINQDATGALKCLAFGAGEYTLKDDLWEEIARKIHQAYRDLREAQAGDDPEKKARLAADGAMKDWDLLNEDLRDSNRQQALHMPIKLRVVGLKMARKEEPGEAVAVFTDDQVKVLGEIEHRRWLAERLMANWSFAPQKNILKRESPSILPWSALSDDVREYDYQAVRQIPSILDAAGWKMCRK